MTDTWLVRVYNDHVLAMFKECAGPLELGRQNEKAGETLYDVSTLPERGSRIAIAQKDEVKISRRLAWVESISGRRVKIRNMSEHVSFGLEGAALLKPGQECEAELPAVLTLGNKVIRIQTTSHEDSGRAIQSLEKPTDLPYTHDDPESPLTTWNLNTPQKPAIDGVLGWLRAMIRVLQSAACDADFFQKGAQAVVEVVRLDLGWVFTHDGDAWKTVAFHPESAGEEERHKPPSRLVMNRVCEEKRTSWFDPLGLDEHCSSLAGVSSVVAAPVLDRSGSVIAILYGERRLQSLVTGAASPVSRVDAMMVEVLAVGLSTGLARLEQERAALALHAQLEQFFGPELASQLATRPELLNGQDLEITVLFCDIRGFSRITRNHGPAFTLEWTNDVLSTLSDCVLDYKGVLVDYIGDEMMAMWGARRLSRTTPSALASPPSRSSAHSRR